MTAPRTDISRMPRGGFDASLLDRLLQTGLSEYPDRDDADPQLRRQAIEGQEWTDRMLHTHQRVAQCVLDAVAERPDPTVLELGAGRGELSRLLLADHPTLTVTVSDIDPQAVAALTEGPLRAAHRARVRLLDATDLDAGDDEFDVAVFAFGLHHLSPTGAAQMFAEATRVAREVIVVDLSRPPSPLHLVRLAFVAPLAPVIPFLHDVMISSLRSYSPSAIRTLVAAAAERSGTEIDVEVGRLGPDVLVRARRSRVA
ncbi:class I SAM-dependent methyltransferase [Mycolicibacterium fallax]|uniref:Methyltransferase type 11 n=1 Tax=Mycolicibacterium fallax TaxID=1793 RepID=A0A1X1RKA5_MYCFA|nr:class I SAM-dependent methyltransferase [Mycolicibacterium fallax]ORV08108.1 methyltransferase type 11 [Mycolicibacterium fallax]BBY99537.1 methyltransferase type 11 [Mycolicibacterium fallax]HOW94437.1 methyltransferase domain-containing protein [Mycolicibacterium fallax]